MKRDEITGWRRGLGPRTSVGSQSAYRPGAGQDQMRAGTLLWQNGVLHTLGEKAGPAMALALPDAHRVEVDRRSWTGRRIRWEWERGAVEMELRSTLPGPLFECAHGELALTWLGGSEPTAIHEVEDGRVWDCRGAPDLGDARLLVARSGRGELLFVLPGGAREIKIVSHAHWVLRGAAGMRVLIVKLAGERDRPTDATRRTAWLELAAAPPLEAEEYHRACEGGLELLQVFADASHAPLPPAWAALGESGGLWQLSTEPLHLVDLPGGPYRLVRGERWTGKVATGWMRAKLAAGGARDEGPEGRLPSELAYPGDNTWRPETAPLDRMMTMRLWAPYWACLPTAAREALREWLLPESAEAVRASLMTVRDPVLGLDYARDAALFEESGDVSYDADWYNGLTLSGLARGAEIADGRIAAEAGALAAALKPERAKLLAYFAIYADWAQGTAWTDARGMFLNANCALNGLEGILAEGRMRLREGDEDGARECDYLAARTALGYLALHAQASHARKLGWTNGDTGDGHFGAKGLNDVGGLTPMTRRTKNLYFFPGHFPEGAALLRRHGDRAALDALLAAWDEPDEVARRKADWLAYYLSDDPASPTFPCERREQGALTFLTAAELCARVWVAGQSAERAAANYGRPLALPDRAMLQTRLEIPGERVDEARQRIDGIAIGRWPEGPPATGACFAGSAGRNA